jgi:hypothetical protein
MSETSGPLPPEPIAGELPVASPKKSFAKKLAEMKMEQIAQRADNHPAAARMIIRLANEEPLGVGGEKIVYTDPNNQDQVISFMHLDTTRELPDYWEPTDLDEENLAQNQIIPPHRIKARFYLSKLLASIAPSTIPDVRFAGSQPPMLKSEKVQVAEEPQEEFEGDYYSREYHEYEARQRRKFSEATKPIDDQLHALGLTYDGAEGNYVKRKDDSYVYVDTIDLESAEAIQKINISKITEAIDRLEPNQRPKALRSFEKLMENVPDLRKRYEAEMATIEPNSK